MDCIQGQILLSKNGDDKKAVNHVWEMLLADSYNGNIISTVPSK